MDKTAVITGATGGIGSEYAQQLAAAGYNLLLTCLNEPALQQKAQELKEQYATEVHYVAADLDNEQGLLRLCHHLQQLPRVDLLVNCAGYGERARFADEAPDTIEKMLRVHIHAPVRLTHTVLPGMIRQGGGSVICISSLGAFLPSAGSSIYSSSKAFLVNFVESLHMEVADNGIRVQALCPGLTHTDFHKGSKVEENISIPGVDLWMEPEEVVSASLKALEKGDVVCIPGRLNSALHLLLPLLPRSQYYALASRVAGRFDG